MPESVEVIIRDERRGQAPESPLTREQISGLSDKQYVDFKRSIESGELDGFLERYHAAKEKAVAKPGVRERARGAASRGAAAASNPLGAVAGFGRIIPGIGAAIAVAAFVRQIISKQLAPGGPFDRRLDIRIERQIVRFQDRQRLRDLQSGRRVLHVTAAAGLRGREGTIYSSNSERSSIDLNESTVRGLR